MDQEKLDKEYAEISEEMDHVVSELKQAMEKSKGKLAGFAIVAAIDHREDGGEGGENDTRDCFFGCRAVSGLFGGDAIIAHLLSTAHFMVLLKRMGPSAFPILGMLGGMRFEKMDLKEALAMAENPAEAAD